MDTNNNNSPTSVSYHKENILGCKHYPRSCKIKAACCGVFFVCRLCHNDQSKHEIDRFATKEIMCMKCQTVQPVAEKCIGCDIQFARYFCAHCKFYDDTPDKKIYHCDDCKICRVGERDSFIHCKRCNGCLNKVGFEKHVCLDNKFEDSCPICMEDLFSSRDPVVSLKCGHSMHSECNDQFAKSGTIQCPMCKKSAYNLTEYWLRIDAQIARQPMPRMYAGSTCSVLCCDCDKKSMDIALHFLGNKCQHCNSYNTTIIGKNLQIDSSAPEEPLPNPNLPLSDDEEGDDEDIDDDEDMDDDEFDIDEDDEEEDGDEEEIRPGFGEEIDSVLTPILVQQLSQLPVFNSILNGETNLIDDPAIQQLRQNPHIDQLMNVLQQRYQQQNHNPNNPNNNNPNNNNNNQ
ncbi:hypothetical protein DFA_09088 [Cavenderia fasciculata]|uniref:Uncharacterized protein n=1 Tax=Cavenderia fasciculata TaxID=261658 RepID=F4Q6N4_CACFS|nr:uncharacterized protein DFA_09088 [Cavenderia fasciculata]EGG16544.1 hypothetical protein DFA_09088 [Cavenderia fasciculata]|eukprot:XP_004354944.1 hypothetical protein DFA_09088 [Cavenderia fasciculata]